MSKSTSDLREFLFETMHQIRRGDLDATSGRAIADVAKQMNDSARLDLEYAEFVEDKTAKPMQIVNDSPRIESESGGIDKTGPSEDIVMSHYDDGIKPADIAKLVGSDIRTVTEIINSNK